MRSPNPLRRLGLQLAFRSRPFLLPVAAVLLVVNGLYLFVWEQRRADPQVEQIELAMRELSNQVLGVAQGWIETEDDSLYLDQLWRRGFPAEWERQGLSVVLYQDTTMVYWGAYPGTMYGHKKDPLRSSGTVEQIGTAQIVTRVLQHDNKTAVTILLLQDNRRGGVNPSVFEQQQIELLPLGDSIRATLDHAQLVDCSPNQFWVVPGLRSSVPWWAEGAGWVAALLVALHIKGTLRRRTTRHNAIGYAGLLLGCLLLWRMSVYYIGIPNSGGELFRQIYAEPGLLLGSLGDLLLSFSLIAIYASFLYQVNHKLRWQYRRAGRWFKCLVIGTTTLLTACMVTAFHYALTLSIHNSDFDTRLYDISSLSHASAMFYVLVGLYFLALFYLLHTLFQGVQSRLGRYGSFLLSLIVFTAYITYLVARENSHAEHDAQVAYATLLADHSMDDPPTQAELLSSDIRFGELTYARLSADRVLFRYNNSNDYREVFAGVRFDRDTTVSRRGMSHFIHFNRPQRQQHIQEVIVVSRTMVSPLDVAALYAYIFVILFLLGGLILELSGYNVIRMLEWRSPMTARIREVVIGVVVFAVGTMAFIMINHTRQTFYHENRQFVNNTMQRLSASLGQYLLHNPADMASLEQWLRGETNEWAFSLNLYRLDGSLIVTSADNLAGVPRMGSNAFWQMGHLQRPYFINYVDGPRSVSAYVPILKEDERVGYLNMRYHGPQDPDGWTLQKLLTDMLNLFVIILFVAVIMSNILYRFLTRPFAKLQAAMGNISQMQKIEDVTSGRKISDEVGRLIQQYNLMIDYLEESYRQLAASEREGAWREMALQVAHEIKNPLTPMRLRIQMLQRAMKEEKCDDLKPRVEAAFELLLEQIERLSHIAGEFSDFARMGQGEPQRIDLWPLVNSVAELYGGYQNLELRLSRVAGTDIWVMADPDHLTRVLVNICQNAVEAIGNQPDGVIQIELAVQPERAEVSIRIRDNGPGMTEETKRKIFQPNFTTKSSGSGLGLALSRKIVEASGGRIGFESTNHGKHRGTCFIVTLPMVP